MDRVGGGGGATILGIAFFFLKFVCVIKESSDHIHSWQIKRSICISRQRKFQFPLPFLA